MSHIFRFIAANAEGNIWSLTGDEAHHFSKVLRLNEGTPVEVTDGRGTWAKGIATSVNSREILVEATETQVSLPPCVRVELAIGALRPASVDEILPMLCELGVDRVHVFGQVGVAKARLGEKVIERWRRILIQSIKQCKRPWLPELTEHGSLSDLLMARDAEHCVRICLHPSGGRLLSSAITSVSSGSLLAIIGGEKGFDPSEERAIAEAGIEFVTLGEGILRAVTAAIATASAVSLHREQLWYHKR